MEQDYKLYQGVYVHTPFCRQKCLYCDFPSFAGFKEQQMVAYARAVAKEIAYRSQESQLLQPKATIYFGGGTPSLLPLEALSLMVQALKAYGFWQQPIEATIEVNPGTVTLRTLQQLRALGFNRISMGVQSFQDQELRAIGRIHRGQEAKEALLQAQAAGFTRISCDLIYGLPGQTLESLRENLQQALDLGLTHVSVYGLIVEEGTALEGLLAKGEIKLPEEELVEDMYQLVQNTLPQAGLKRYEISNYAVPGQESRHNLVYWHYHPYIAFGSGACGYRGSRRRTGLIGPKEYTGLLEGLPKTPYNNVESGIGQLEKAGLYEIEDLSQREQLGEFMFMGLRTRQGADLREAQERFGIKVLEAFDKDLEPFFHQGLVEYNNKSQRLALTEAGMALGNQIFEIFV